MEPVRLPKVIAPVTHADRVKRAKAREDSGGGSAFGRYLRQNKSDSVDAPDEPTDCPDPARPEDPGPSGGHLKKKLIDIRV
jgi:hypothetical protein